MPEWERKTIGEVFTLQRGFDITRAAQRAGTVPVISSGGISSYHDHAMDRGPGVVMGRKGTLGRIFYVDEPYWPHDTTLWVKDFKDSNPRFVYYFLHTLDLLGLDVGSANPTLNRNHVHPIVVRWPSRRIQDNIASLLGALDDKIAVNHRITTTCISLGHALFTEIAVGANDRAALSEILDLRYGKALPSGSRIASNVPVFGSGGVVGYHNNPLVAGPGLVVGRKGTVGAVHWSTSSFFPIDTTFYVVSRSSDYSMEFLYFTLLHAELSKMNSDSAVPGLNRANALAQRVPLPDVPTLRAFTGRASRLFSRRDAAEKESAALSSIRDAILPKLISGELQIKDSEQIVSNAV